MIVWRDAVAADAAALTELFAHCFSATFGHLYKAADLDAFLSAKTPAQWAAEIADPGFVVRIGEADGIAAGLLKLGPPALPVERTGPTIELRQLYLRAEHHGTGAAREAMDWAIATARARGAAFIDLTVYVDNHRARRVYERYGFERIGRYIFMIGDHGDEDDIMRLTL